MTFSATQKEGTQSRDRRDRGLTIRHGSVYVRVWCGMKEVNFGPFYTKTIAREFYQKVKREQALQRFFPERYHRVGHVSGIPVFAVKFHHSTTKEDRREWEKAKKMYEQLRKLIRKQQRRFPGV